MPDIDDTRNVYLPYRVSRQQHETLVKRADKRRAREDRVHILSTDSDTRSDSERTDNARSTHHDHNARSTRAA